MPSHPRLRRSAGALATLALVVTLAACGEEPPASAPEPDEPTPSVTEEPMPEPSEEPSASPTPEETEPAEDDDAGETGLATSLVDADELPGDLSWVIDDAGAGEPDDTVAYCQPFPLESIGATETLEREFDVEGQDSDSEAVQVIATAADAATAQRMYAVLRSWHADCPDAGPLNQVATGRQQAAWYVASYRDDGDQHWDAHAIAQKKKRVSIVRVDVVSRRDPFGEGDLATLARTALDKLP